MKIQLKMEEQHTVAHYQLVILEIRQKKCMHNKTVNITYHRLKILLQNQSSFKSPLDLELPSALCKLSFIFTISCRKTDALKGGLEKHVEMMNNCQEKNQTSTPQDKEDPYSLLKPHTKFIVDEMVKSFNEGKLVYCRFGK